MALQAPSSARPGKTGGLTFDVDGFYPHAVSWYKTSDDCIYVGVGHTRFADFRMKESDAQKYRFPCLVFSGSKKGEIKVVEGAGLFPPPPDKVISKGLLVGILGVLDLFINKYIVVVTNRERVTDLNGHVIWRIRSAMLIPYFQKIPFPIYKEEKLETEYCDWMYRILGAKNLFYSYTYPLPLSNKLIASDITGARFPLYESTFEAGVDKELPDFYFWNKSIACALGEEAKYYALPIISGYVGACQLRVPLAASMGRKSDSRVVLISRTSRHRAGTRYFSRGIDHRGHTANQVETEQILIVPQYRVDAEAPSDPFRNFAIAGSTAVGIGFGNNNNNSNGSAFGAGGGGSPIGYSAKGQDPHAISKSTSQGNSSQAGDGYANAKGNSSGNGKGNSSGSGNGIGIGVAFSAKSSGASNARGGSAAGINGDDSMKIEGLQTPPRSDPSGEPFRRSHLISGGTPSPYQLAVGHLVRDENNSSTISTGNGYGGESSSVRTLFLSHVQIRGSVPLFWEQQANLDYRPDIRIIPNKPLSLQALRVHFERLKRWYGQVTAFNLLNTQGFEAPLTAAYEELVRDLCDEQVAFADFSFHQVYGWKSMNNPSLVYDKIKMHMQRQGFSIVRWRASDACEISDIQRGIIRTNCLDNLDRTNLVQSIIGRRILAEQLVFAGYILDPSKVESLVSLASLDLFREMWAENGNSISHAYAGTPALKMEVIRAGRRSLVGALRDGVSSLSRWYLNNLSDGSKQDALWALLGSEPNYSLTRVIERRRTISPDEASAGWGVFLLGLILRTASPRTVDTVPNFVLAIGWLLIVLVLWTLMRFDGRQLLSMIRLGMGPDDVNNSDNNLSNDHDHDHDREDSDVAGEHDGHGAHHLRAASGGDNLNLNNDNAKTSSANHH